MSNRVTRRAGRPRARVEPARPGIRRRPRPRIDLRRVLDRAWLDLLDSRPLAWARRVEWHPRYWSQFAGRARRRIEELEPGERLRRLRRPAAAVAAAGEIGLIGWLCISPGFQPHEVDISGVTQIDRSSVLGAAGLGRSSVFLLDPRLARDGLESLPTVASAEVRAGIDGRVVVSVIERQPVAEYLVANGQVAAYLTDDGLVTSYGPVRPDLLLIHTPSGVMPRINRRPAVNPQLLAAMLGLKRGLPGLLGPGQEVKSFEIQRCGELTMETTRGWRADFGRVLTGDDLSLLRSKVAALRSLEQPDAQGRPAVDFSSPDLEYVNLVNPGLPAVKLRSATPPPTPTPSPASGGGAGSRPAASPSPGQPAITTIQVVTSCQ